MYGQYIEYLYTFWNFSITCHVANPNRVLKGYAYRRCIKPWITIFEKDILYAEGAKSRSRQRQTRVAISLTEAEVIIASEKSKEILWLRIIVGRNDKIKEIPIRQVYNIVSVKLTHSPIHIIGERNEQK